MAAAGQAGWNYDWPAYQSSAGYPGYDAYAAYYYGQGQVAPHQQGAVPVTTTAQPPLPPPDSEAPPPGTAPSEASAAGASTSAAVGASTATAAADYQAQWAQWYASSNAYPAPQHTQSNPWGTYYQAQGTQPPAAYPSYPGAAPPPYQPVPGPRPPPGNPPPAASPQAPAARPTSTVPWSSPSYNSVPPPAALSGTPRPPASGGSGLVIRPQVPTGAKRTPIPSGPPAYTSTYTKPVTFGAAAASKLSYASVAGGSSATLGGSAQQQSTSQKQAAARFPPTFQGWVERCFNRCSSDTERAAMTKQLTQHIKSIEAAGRMWLVDWDTEAIPSISGSTQGGSTSSMSTVQQGGLRSKRSRWEEEQKVQEHTQQQQSSKQAQQQGKGKKQKKGQQASDADHWSAAEQRKIAQRAGRFGDGRAVGGVQSWRPGSTGSRSRSRYADDSDDDYGSDDDYDASSVVIRGTCQELEKSYFRLTAAPDPSVVRPEPVLRKALDRLVGMLREGRANWFYACDQFKGLRQDCTVQHLRNELSVQVYEAHARAALEYGDLAEFNQCQTQLAGLYADGIKGCVAEFTAYRVLYNTVHGGSGTRGGGGNNKALLNTMRTALAMLAGPNAGGRPASLQRGAAGPFSGSDAAATKAGGGGSSSLVDPEGAIANALAARQAAASANYPAFFKAYAAAPALGRALLDILAPRLRFAALNVLVKVYKASLPLTFVAAALGFLPSSTSRPDTTGTRAQPLPGCQLAECRGKAAPGATADEGIQLCEQWLVAHGAVIEPATEPGAPALLDVKGSLGKLSVPEEPKVAHGDENLSLEDFLSRASGIKA